MQTCETCKGSGRVSSKDGKPWSEINVTPNADVRAGRITPKVCEKCNGAGMTGKGLDPAMLAAPNPQAILENTQVTNPTETKK